MHNSVDIIIHVKLLSIIGFLWWFLVACDFWSESHALQNCFSFATFCCWCWHLAHIELRNRISAAGYFSWVPTPWSSGKGHFAEFPSNDFYRFTPPGGYIQPENFDTWKWQSRNHLLRRESEATLLPYSNSCRNSSFPWRWNDPSSSAVYKLGRTFWVAALHPALLTPFGTARGQCRPALRNTAPLGYPKLQLHQS